MTTPAAAWINAATSSLPSARAEMGCCYFPPLGATIFFGGYNGSSFFNATFKYVASTNTWSTVSTVHSPSGRWAIGQMAYDSHRQVIVLFGGYTGSFNNETWEFNGTDWTQITTTHTPGGREQGGMAFDQVNNVMVLYSGAQSGSAVDDTWTYNGTDWTQKSPTHTPGTLNGNGGNGRYEHKMAWDPVQQAVMMVGGLVNETGTPDTHVYYWSGTDWSSVTPAHPVTTASQAMVNNGSNVIIPQDSYNDTNTGWMWTGTDWVTYFNDGGGPPIRTSMDAAYDPTAGSAGAIVFSCGFVIGTGYVADLWQLLMPGPTATVTCFFPMSLSSGLVNGGGQVVNAINLSPALVASVGPFFGLPAAGMYAMSITPDGLLGIITEIQANTASSAGHCWVFPMSNPSSFTQITLAQPQPRSCPIIPTKVSGHWYALVMSAGSWVGGHNSGGAVDVVDMSASPPAIVRSIATAGIYPEQAAVTPDGKTAIIQDGGIPGTSVNIYTIDLTQALANWSLTAGPTLSGDQNPQDLVISPNGATAWISATGPANGNVVWPLTISGMTFGSAIACSSGPGVLAVTADSSKLWVGCSGANKLLRIDTASKAVDHTTTFTGTAGAGGSGYPVVLTPDGKTLVFTEGQPPGHIWTMDTAALTPTDTGLVVPGYGSYLAAMLATAVGAPSGRSLLGVGT